MTASNEAICLADEREDDFKEKCLFSRNLSNEHRVHSVAKMSDNFIDFGMMVIKSYVISETFSVMRQFVGNV